MRAGMVGLGGSGGGSWGEVGQGVAVAVCSMTERITNVSFPVKGARRRRDAGGAGAARACGAELVHGVLAPAGETGAVCDRPLGDGRAARPVQVHGVFLAVTIGLVGGPVRQAGEQEFGTTDAHR
jgi:hypothetical protein